MSSQANKATRYPSLTSNDNVEPLNDHLAPIACDTSRSTQTLPSFSALVAGGSYPIINPPTFPTGLSRSQRPSHTALLAHILSYPATSRASTFPPTPPSTRPATHNLSQSAPPVHRYQLGPAASRAQQAQSHTVVGLSEANQTDRQAGKERNAGRAGKKATACSECHARKQKVRLIHFEADYVYLNEHQAD